MDIIIKCHNVACNNYHVDYCLSFIIEHDVYGKCLSYENDTEKASFPLPPVKL